MVLIGCMFFLGVRVKLVYFLSLRDLRFNVGILVVSVLIGLRLKL